jgi:hypothetical protein
LVQQLLAHLSYHGHVMHGTVLISGYDCAWRTVLAKHCSVSLKEGKGSRLVVLELIRQVVPLRVRHRADCLEWLPHVRVSAVTTHAATRPFASSTRTPPSARPGLPEELATTQTQYLPASNDSTVNMLAGGHIMHVGCKWDTPGSSSGGWAGLPTHHLFACPARRFLCP